jgi:hypothetical protein
LTWRVRRFTLAVRAYNAAMASLPAAPTPPPRRRTVRERRPWAVTVIGWLLLLETAGFLGLSALYLGPLGLRWPISFPLLGAGWNSTLIGLLFGGLGLLAMAGALGFLRLRRGGWVSAVFVQGATLLMALVLYFRGRPDFVPAYAYVMMVGGILMVLYLHQADVQAAFRENTTAAMEERG